MSTIAHKHDINPSAHATAQTVPELISNLPANQRRELQADWISQ